MLVTIGVSTQVALTEAGLYIADHLTENDCIAPSMSGDRLEPSTLAVILAFVVGATIGGIIGAVVAPPFAALSAVIENKPVRPSRFSFARSTSG